MTDRYIALRTLKLGNAIISTGSVVERVNDGRDWDQMVRVGDVKEAPPSAEVSAAGRPAKLLPQPPPEVKAIDTTEALDAADVVEVIETEEAAPGDWYCSDCARTFETEHGLRIHRAKVHSS